MPNQPKTPFHRFRLDEDKWAEFERNVARADPESDRSKILRQFIAWYAREPGAKLPARPPAAGAGDKS